MVGNDSALQHLLRGHPGDNQWPSDNNLYQFLHKFEQSERFTELVCVQCQDHRYNIVNLPIVLAVQVAIGEVDWWYETATRIHLLRTCQAFDPDWFEAAFDLTIARCYSRGLLG
jgi:hypothetical protein